MSKNQSVKKRQKLDTHTLSRLLKFIFKNFKLEFIVLAVCVLLNAVSVLTASIFLRIIIDECIRPVKEFFQKLRMLKNSE